MLPTPRPTMHLTLSPLIIPKPAAATAPEVLPRALQIRLDGQAFALWMDVQGEALIVWRAGDSTPVSLPGPALRSFAWSPDGFYFSVPSAQEEGQGEIWRYRWDDRPQQVVGRSQLKGVPQAMAWDATGNRLVFGDNAGLHAVADGTAVTPVAGPWGSGAVYGGVFAPSHLRYVTLLKGELVLATAGDADAQPLLAAPDSVLNRVAWAEDGGRVAVETEDRQRHQRQVTVIDLPRDGSRPAVRQFAGSNPVLVGDSLWYLPAAAERSPVRVRLSDGQEQGLGVDDIHALAAEPAAGRVYLLQAGGDHRVLRFTIDGSRA